MSDPEKIVAVSLLTEQELQAYGANLKIVYSLPDDGAFHDLLQRIERMSDSDRVPKPRGCFFHQP